jgi:hypothetical protein
VKLLLPATTPLTVIVTVEVAGAVLTARLIEQYPAPSASIALEVALKKFVADCELTDVKTAPVALQPITAFTNATLLASKNE